MRTLIGLCFLVFSASAALAHPGGLDKHGCHHDKRKYNSYHCHIKAQKTTDVYRRGSVFADRPMVNYIDQK